MDKVSSEQIAQVLSHVPETLRKLSAERDYWRKEAQARIRRDDAVKVAAEMHEKGMDLDVPFEELVGRMEKMAERGELSTWAQAVSKFGPNMSSKLASLDNERPEVFEGNMLVNYLSGSVA